jgi:hypothetical protein
MTFVRDPPAPGDVPASDVPETVPGNPRLRAAAWAIWQAGRAEVAAKNAALTAQGVARQRAEIEAARAPAMAKAQAQLAEVIGIRAAAIIASREKARKWAAEHPDAADRLAEYQAAANARAAES